jgi:hypothetical protein
VIQEVTVVSARTGAGRERANTRKRKLKPENLIIQLRASVKADQSLSAMRKVSSGASSPSGPCRPWLRLLERRAMTLPADLDTFLQEHRRCGETNPAVEGNCVWTTCKRWS